MKRSIAIMFLFILATSFPLAGYAQEQGQQEDLFDFMPSGGRTLLADLVAAGLDEQVQNQLLTTTRSRSEWLTYLSTQAGADPISALDEFQRQTLADYLAAHMPLAQRPAQVNADTLPRDGRDLALEYCQSCHIITVVVTQDRAKEAWLGTMHKPSHIEVNLTEAEREELADYLVVNAGIPIEQVPQALRAGGASY